MEKKLDFKISAGLKNIIGKELITEDHTAIFELVKNSYDADATNVKIIFQNIKSEDNTKSKILIVDNGVGMSYEELKNKWLFVGYSEKKLDSSQENFIDKMSKNKRIFAGAKGIGRFSADRLGAKLRMYTKTANNSDIHFIDLDWRKFEHNQQKEFHKIKVEYITTKHMSLENFELKTFKHGTVLEIYPLNTVWNEDKLLRLRRYLQRLVNPNQLEKNNQFEIEVIAKEFSYDDRGKPNYLKINGKIENIVFEKLKIKTTELSSEIKDGKIITTLKDKGRFVFTIEEENTFELLDNISIKVFFLNRDAKAEFTRTMGLVPVRFGSIFLYKNGFRIQPYGDEGDDWLNLDKRKTQGHSRYLSTREIMGRIELQGPQPEFKEVSSRSGGVVYTSGYEQLIDFFISKVLRRIERYVVEGIDWDKPVEERRKTEDEIMHDSLEIVSKLAGQVKDPQKSIRFNPDLLNIFKERQIENLPDMVKNLEPVMDFLPTKDRKYVESQIKRITNISKTYSQEMKSVAKEKEQSEKELLFLKKTLSNDAQMVQDYNHSITITTGNIATYLKELIDLVKNHSSTDKILEGIEKISIENQKARVLASIITNATFDLKLSKIPADIPSYIKQYLQQVISRVSNRIQFKFINEDIEFKTKFIPLELSMILDNFISNSRKANSTKMSFQFKVKNKKLHLLVADNGRGISKEDRKFLFKRGFTTTKHGSGIGLTHIKTSIEKMGGSVRFVENNFEDLGKGACFELVFE